jgi:hypothetical protein
MAGELFSHAKRCAKGKEILPTAPCIWHDSRNTTLENM